ncbi:FtsK/SpoIIIE domain-containing protein [Scatolibacter rhodanostii]|uniref:FtsK/SpoIIIE domain-containing protein n=1 Tax=Scatolibacter rhodanostii TaxID=2014781 RepID=UPI000C078651|nr:FtsK/SpoIIIE domain-containing protein [Scatolibacter rhodanostii]
MFVSHGKRIKPSDKSLVKNFALACLIPCFLAILLIFNLYSLLQIDWSVSLLGIAKQFKISPILIISVLVGLLACGGLVWWYQYYQCDHYRQLRHRQALARMILDNHWYDTVKVEDSRFFTDTKSKTKDKISYWPKIFYQMKDCKLHIKVEVTMGKYQEQLLNLEKKLESGLFCELTDKEQLEGFIQYTLLYDMVANRIAIDEVKAENGKLQLMKNLSWKYDSLPNMLICGGVGGGKTYFILTIIKALLETNAKMYVLDPKNADLADLASVMTNVYSKPNDIINIIDRFHADMINRSEIIKQLSSYRTGENYAYAGLEANFLVFDEYVAFMELIGTKESGPVIAKLKQIVMMGRQLGFFVILACQRPDAKYFADGIRDQFNFRVALGRMSELGYSMMFGETKKQFFLKPIKGRGYVDTGVSVISEFYTPLVPKGYDFLYEIEKVASKGHPKQPDCEA